jgi:hypothetical protein
VAANLEGTSASEVDREGYKDYKLNGREKDESREIENYCYTTVSSIKLYAV